MVDDPTVAKCGRFARAWGYGGIHVGNTFAYRAIDKKRLRLIADPIGPENDKHLIAMAKLATIVIFAYGQPWARAKSPDTSTLRNPAAALRCGACRPASL